MPVESSGVPSLGMALDDSRHTPMARGHMMAKKGAFFKTMGTYAQPRSVMSQAVRSNSSRLTLATKPFFSSCASGNMVM